MEDTEQEYLNLGEVLGFMATKGHIYENSEGVDINTYRSFTARLNIYDKGPVQFALCVEMRDDDPELTRKLGIRSFEDLERMNADQLWLQYKRGEAHVVATLDYWNDAEIHFRTEFVYTVISCEQLGYEDKEVGAWDTVEHFRDYVREHIQELYMAAEEVGEEEDDEDE